MEVKKKKKGGGWENGDEENDLKVTDTGRSRLRNGACFFSPHRGCECV